MKSEITKRNNSYRFFFRKQTKFRSPFSNEFFPEPITNYYVSRNIRKFEISLQFLLGEYAKLYFDDALYSAYVFEKGEGHLNIIFYIKKDIHDQNLLKTGFYHSRMIAIIDQDANKQTTSLSFKLENNVEFSKHYVSNDNEHIHVSGFLSSRVTFFGCLKKRDQKLTK